MSSLLQPIYEAKFLKTRAYSTYTWAYTGVYLIEIKFGWIVVWIKCYLYLSLGLTLTLNNFVVIIVLLVQVHPINFTSTLVLTY